MTKQKVVTINVLLRTKGTETPGILEREPEKLNQYLEQGYKVVDRFSTVSNADLFVINLTFILEKEEN